MFGDIFKELLTAAIPKIIEWGKKFFDKLTETPQMNDNNTAVDIEEIGKALADLRENVLKQSKPVIDNASNLIMAYLEEQLFMLDNKSELSAKYEISSRSVEHKLQSINRRTGEYWRNAIQLRISLDNAKCREILMMPTGAMKAASIKQFTDAVLSDTLNEYSEILRRELGNLYIDFEDEVARSLSRLENTVAEYGAVIKSLDNKDNDEFESLIAKANLKIFCYDAILSKVRA